MTYACFHCKNFGYPSCSKCNQQQGSEILYEFAELAELQRRRNLLIEACFDACYDDYFPELPNE